MGIVAIISVFIGQYLTKVLNDIETRVGNKLDEENETTLKLDLHRSIPELMLDNTDRNRTSPFAFTGNKFEFRAVGSSANCANAMTVLNTIMAETLKQFKKEVDGLIHKGEKKEAAILHIIQQYIRVICILKRQKYYLQKEIILKQLLLMRVHWL